MEIAASPWRVNCPATHRIRRANQVNCFTDHSVRLATWRLRSGDSDRMRPEWQSGAERGSTADTP